MTEDISVDQNPLSVHGEAEPPVWNNDVLIWDCKNIFPPYEALPAELNHLPP